MVAALTQAIRRDWASATSDPRTQTRVCSSWFRGRDPRIGREVFDRRWLTLGGGALCSVEDDRLVIRLSLAFPVPFEALAAG